MIAIGLVAAALLGVATPACAMPDCVDVSAGDCSESAPVCDECPGTIIMKHGSDDAVSVTAIAAEPPADSVAAVAPIASASCPGVPWIPEATGAPPPLDPLGVRLTLCRKLLA